MSGIVYLVGAGPGDPGLMTRRSLELIESADAILYDRLIPAGALAGAREDADLRYVGQSFELTVPLGADVAEAFHRAHEDRYGYADRERPLELVAVRTRRAYHPLPETRNVEVE